MKAAIYARVSTLDQQPENQLQELRRYVQARSWTSQEYVDRGISECLSAVATPKGPETGPSRGFARHH